jgi:hypothetical protein
MRDPGCGMILISSPTRSIRLDTFPQRSSPVSAIVRQTPYGWHRTTRCPRNRRSLGLRARANAARKYSRAAFEAAAAKLKFAERSRIERISCKAVAVNDRADLIEHLLGSLLLSGAKISSTTGASVHLLSMSVPSSGAKVRRRALAPHNIECAIFRSGQEPGEWILRHAAPHPAARHKASRTTSSANVRL